MRRKTVRLNDGPRSEGGKANDEIRNSELNSTSTLSVIDSGNPPTLPPRRDQAERPLSTRGVNAADHGHRSAATIYKSERYKKLEAPRRFSPPPKRAAIPVAQSILDQRSPASTCTFNGLYGQKTQSDDIPSRDYELEHSGSINLIFDPPDVSSTNRRPPHSKSGAVEIDTTNGSRLVDICGQFVATTGHTTRVWDAMSSKLVLNINHGDKEIRVTSLAFKPAATAREEGYDLWLGTNAGELQEVNIPTQSVVATRTGPHERREIVRIHRYQSSLWTLDDSGRLCVWHGDDTGLPTLESKPVVHRVPRDYSSSLVIQGHLWLATGKDIRVFRPNAPDEATYTVLQKPFCQQAAGVVTSAAVIGNQLDRVFFGHADGKITFYSVTDFVFLGVVSISNYRVSCLSGAGCYLWVGHSTGIVSVFDTKTQPWITKKTWPAHGSPIVNILTDPGSLWQNEVMRLVTLGADNLLRFWDGTLETDWLGNYLLFNAAFWPFADNPQRMTCTIVTLNIVLFVS